MKHASLSAAAALVLLASAFALVHAARNRSGDIETDIVLTQRELYYYGDPDDSGVALTLRWVDSGAPRYSTAVKPEEVEARNWLDRKKLTELGFDCHLDPSDKDAYSFYNRQSARTAFAALEYDGPAWQSWIELNDRIVRAEQSGAGQQPAVDYQRNETSRLVAIDAARDASALRARYPDRSRILIAPAVIRISVGSIWRPQSPSILTGYLQEIPSVIHVPRPYSDEFRATPRRNSYRVRLLYGKYLEPWVAGVEFPK
jgi:hypothetical protein